MVDTTADVDVDRVMVLWDHDGGSMPESTRDNSIRDNSIRDNEPTQILTSGAQTSKTETQTEVANFSQTEYEYAMERVRKSPLHSIELSMFKCL